MRNYKCYLCDALVSEKIGYTNCVLKIPVLKCCNCGLVSLETFDHIDDSYYHRSAMRAKELNHRDLYDGLNCEKFIEWRKMTQHDDLNRYERLKDKIINKDVLDFGAGNGGFLKKISLLASSVTAVEVDWNAIDNMKKENILTFQDLKSIPLNRKFDIITSFHVFEHLKDPISTLKELATYLNKDGSLILEFPNANDALITLYESKEFSEFTYRNDHIFLFNIENTKKMIEKASLKCKKVSQVQRFPLSNHLYWLVMGKPAGEKVWKFLNSDMLNGEYKNHLASMGYCDTIMVEIEK